MQKASLLKIMPLFLLISALTFQASAQYSVGIRGGINISNLWGKYQNSNFETKLGPVFGVVGQYQSNEWFSLHAELNYDAWGTKYNEVVDDGVVYKTEYKDIVRDANYLTVPVLAKFDLGKKHRVFAYTGLYFGFLLSANITGNEVITNKYDPGDVTSTPFDRDYKDELNNFDMGAVLGLGADFKLGESMSIFIDGRYNWGWLYVPPQGQGNLYNSVWTFNLGLMYQIQGKDQE
jgi:hypothetical protein